MTAWTRVDGGEYNEQTARVGDHVVTISSDRDGERWDCWVDEEDVFSLDATDETTARREAEKEAKLL